MLSTLVHCSFRLALRNTRNQCRRAAVTYLEGFTKFKGERHVPLFLSPVVVCLGVADNDSPAVLIEARIKVEGDIMPSLEIQSKSDSNQRPQ